MSKTMIEIAKQKDDGSFAKMGMMQYCADWFNVPYMSKCTEYMEGNLLEQNHVISLGHRWTEFLDYQL